MIDLGHQPPSNAYLTSDQLLLPELTYPLRLLVCTSCWLVQLPAYGEASELFTPDYAYFSSTSTSWCIHAETFVDSAVSRLRLDSHSHVVELASNDGYLLQYVMQRGIPCLGIEPTYAAAEVARKKGIPTLEKFFGCHLAKELQLADLVVVNNVLAHVPDINDFMAGIACLLKPQGLASIECPHLLRLVQNNQFDTIYHEHYSYLSLQVVERIAASVGLILVDVEELLTHGGSLRYWMAHKFSKHKSTASVDLIRAKEKACNLESLDVWSDFERRSEAVKNDLLRFLLKEKEAGQTVMGYGAAAKGNTLLNYAGVRSDLLPAVADRALIKQNKYLPGSHIPVISPERMMERDPGTLLVLPWNLINEVAQQWPGRRLATSIPTFQVRS